MKKCMYKETYIQNNAEKYQDWTLQWFYYHQMSLADNAKHMINSCFLNYAYSCIVIFLVYIHVYMYQYFYDYVHCMYTDVCYLTMLWFRLDFKCYSRKLDSMEG